MDVIRFHTRPSTSSDSLSLTDAASSKRSVSTNSSNSDSSSSSSVSRIPAKLSTNSAGIARTIAGPSASLAAFSAHSLHRNTCAMSSSPTRVTWTDAGLSRQDSQNLTSPASPNHPDSSANKVSPLCHKARRGGLQMHDNQRTRNACLRQHSRLLVSAKFSTLSG